MLLLEEGLLLAAHLGGGIKVALEVGAHRLALARVLAEPHEEVEALDGRERVPLTRAQRVDERHARALRPRLLPLGVALVEKEEVGEEVRPRQRDRLLVGDGGD